MRLNKTDFLVFALVAGILLLASHLAAIESEHAEETHAVKIARKHARTALEREQKERAREYAELYSKAALMTGIGGSK